MDKEASIEQRKIEGQYNHRLIEEVEAKKFAECFRADEKSEKRKFCIAIPPPNITGSLHIGHALNMTIQDIIARYKRMRGFEVLWVPGTDHAGIATQVVVSRELEKEGIKREQLSKEEFLKFVDRWREKSQNTIRKQMEKLMLSVDWSAARFTLDDGYRKTVAKAFCELYRNGLIYKGNYVVNWCVSCKTALSDLEVEFSEELGKLYYILYPLSPDLSNPEGITVATTRPETLLGDTAVAVHPDDPRYKEFTYVYVPLAWRKVPVIRDIKIDMNFGTGAVKITPFHDFADFEIGREHKLDGIQIMDKDGKITYGEYSEFDRFSAREKIIRDLENLNLLKKVEDYKIRIGRCYRCKTIVEPLVSTQWFVKIKELAGPAVEAVKSSKVLFLSERWKNLYISWMENIRDWCISRQIWWGHQIPVATCLGCGKEFITWDGEIETRKCPYCGSQEYREETDVLDTWFSSALWPFAILGWPEKTEKLKAFYPTDILVTGFDIIFFWVARMIMMGLYFMNEVPFRKVFVHGLIRDERGQKMSKTKGNVLDPLELIEKYGADTVRFTLSMLTSQIKDIRLSEKTFESFYHFMNKIWNASKFVISHVSCYRENFQPKTIPQQWIIVKMHNCINKVIDFLEEEKLSQAATVIYEFFWNDFCDWYIEISKTELKDETLSLSAQYTLGMVLVNLLKVLHIFCPGITDYIWDLIRERWGLSPEIISFAKFPEKEELKDEEIEILTLGEKLISIVKEIRALKSELGFRNSDIVKAEVRCFDDYRFLSAIRDNIRWMEKLAGAHIHPELGEEISPEFIPSSTKGIAVGISKEGAKIKETTEKIAKELSKAEKEFERVTKRLSDYRFLEEADEETIDDHKRRIEELSLRIEYLKKRLEVLRKIGGL